MKNPARTKFVYRDRLWEGADLLGLGVASFGHINGVHVQNLDTWPKYQEAIERGEIPLGRAYRPTHEERMIREFVLQLKRGSNRPSYFAEKYGVDVLSRFHDALESLRRDGYLAELSRRSHRPDARRAPARRRPAATILPAGTHRHSLHVELRSCMPNRFLLNTMLL